MDEEARRWKRQGITTVHYKDWLIQQHFFRMQWCQVVTSPTGYQDVIFRRYSSPEELLKILKKIVDRYERLKDES